MQLFLSIAFVPIVVGTIHTRTCRSVASPCVWRLTRGRVFTQQRRRSANRLGRRKKHNERTDEPMSSSRRGGRSSVDRYRCRRPAVARLPLASDRRTTSADVCPSTDRVSLERLRGAMRFIDYSCPGGERASGSLFTRRSGEEISTREKPSVEWDDRASRDSIMLSVWITSYVHGFAPLQRLHRNYDARQVYGVNSRHVQLQ